MTAAVPSQTQKFDRELLYVTVCVLGVKGQDTLVVSSDQQHGWDVSGQGFQPGHVQSAGHRSLPRQRHGPSTEGGRTLSSFTAGTIDDRGESRSPFIYTFLHL